MRATEALNNLHNNIGPLEANSDNVQALINLGYLERAQELLEGADPQQLWVKEKWGWVHELTGDYQQAESDFQAVLDSGQITDQSYRTAVHFLGRAKFGIGKIAEARSQFDQDLAASVQDRSATGQAYNLRWLAKCDLAEKKIAGARDKLTKIKSLLSQIEPPGVKAHMLVLEGMICLEENNFDHARVAFSEARQVWQKEDLYVRGAADALLGLATCDLLDGNLEAATQKARQAELEYQWVWVYLS